MYYNLNEDDLVFLANSDSAPIIEHIVKIKTIDRNTNIVSVDKAMSINKMGNEQGSMSYMPIPFFGLISNQANLIGAGHGEMYINLNNFGIVGKVTKKEVIDIFNKFTDESAIKFDAAKSAVLGAK